MDGSRIVAGFAGFAGINIHVWDMAKQTNMAAAVCDFDLRIFACCSYRF